MLVSEKIKRAIEIEVKAQKQLLKLLEAQEKNYKEDYGDKKEAINQSLNYYDKVLKEAA